MAKKSYRIELELPEEWEETLNFAATEMAYREERKVTVPSLIREMIGRQFRLDIPRDFD